MSMNGKIAFAVNHPRGQTAGKGLDGQLLGISGVVENRLGVTAPVIVAGADKQDASHTIHCKTSKSGWQGLGVLRALRGGKGGGKDFYQES